MRARVRHLLRIAERLFPRRDFEVWEALNDSAVYFMVACRLTRQEALDTASLLETAWPRPPTVRIVDGKGVHVYQSSPAGPLPARPHGELATTTAAGAAGAAGAPRRMGEHALSSRPASG